MGGFLRITRNSPLFQKFNFQSFANTEIVVVGDIPSTAIQVFPSPETDNDLKNLVNYPAGTDSISTLNKRAVVASFPTSFGTFTCATNSTTGSPYQDCINTIAAFCQTSSPLFSNWSECHNKVLTVRDKLNTNWKDYVNSCAIFAGGNPSSSYCTGNTTRIVTREVYYYLDASGILRTAYIPRSVTDAIAYIWNT